MKIKQIPILLSLLFLFVMPRFASGADYSTLDRSDRFAKLYEYLKLAKGDADCDDACLVSFYTLTGSVFKLIKEMSDIAIIPAIKNAQVYSAASDMEIVNDAGKALFKNIRFHPMNPEEKNMIQFYSDHMIRHKKHLQAALAGRFIDDTLMRIRSKLMDTLKNEVSAEVMGFINEYKVSRQHLDDEVHDYQIAEKIAEFTLSKVEERVFAAISRDFQEIWVHTTNVVNSKTKGSPYSYEYEFDLEDYGCNVYLHGALEILNGEEQLSWQGIL